KILGARLVKGERESERVRARVRNAQVLADRRHQRLTTLATQSLGHVEHQIGTGQGDFLREERIGFEPDDAAEETESLLHRSNGGRIVPLGERVVGTGWLCGGVRGVRFLVVSETDEHVVSGDLLQKSPLVRSVNPKRV